MESSSAYSMDTLGVLVGLSIASQLPSSDISVYSDGKLVRTKLHKLSNSATPICTKSRDSSLIAAAVSQQQFLKDVKISWIKGHPEKTEADAFLWTREIWGVLKFITAYQYGTSIPTY